MGWKKWSPRVWGLRGCLVSVSKQQFSVFKQHFTYFYTFFHPHVFPQKFLNNNFQFLNTCTKRVLKYIKVWGLSAVLKNYVSESKQKEKRKIESKKIVRDTQWEREQWVKWKREFFFFFSQIISLSVVISI